MEWREKLVQTIEMAKILESNIEHAVFVSHEGSHLAKEVESYFKNSLYDMLQYDLPKYPIDLYHCIQLLKTPIGEWNYFPRDFLDEEGISPEMMILDIDIGLTEEADELLVEYKSTREVGSLVIQEVLIHCRTNQAHIDMQPKYNAFRTFLIGHPLTGADQIELFCLQHDFDPFLSSALERCYEDIPLGKKYKCQACGWTLEEKTKHVFVCLKKECKHSYDVHSLREIEPDETKRVKESIQLSTVIPGLRELELKKRLETKKKAIVYLYPDLERLGDLEVNIEMEGKLVQRYIDVKDYRRPQQLAKRLLEDNRNGLIKTPIIAVPDEKATERYLRFVNEQLMSNGITVCRVYSFKQIEALLDDVVTALEWGTWEELFHV